ncbi:unnamed protein product, partial [marine sediment metagenome]
ASHWDWLDDAPTQYSTWRSRARKEKRLGLGGFVGVW